MAAFRFRDWKRENNLARTDQINKKIDQAMETCRYLSGHCRGSNYDFTGVVEFVPIVVSPFIEWLPNTDQKYWISDTCPRVMSVDELVEYFANEDKGQRA